MNILNKIKNPDDILYEKGRLRSNPAGGTSGGAGGTGGTHLANNGDNRLPSLSPESPEKSMSGAEKSNKFGKKLPLSPGGDEFTLYADDDRAMDAFIRQNRAFLDETIGDGAVYTLLRFAQAARTEEDYKALVSEEFGEINFAADHLPGELWSLYKENGKEITANLGRVRFETPDETKTRFDALIESGEIIRTMVQMARDLQAGSLKPGSPEEERCFNAVQRFTRNTLWQEAIKAAGEPSEHLTERIKAMIRNREESYRLLWADISGDESWKPDLTPDDAEAWQAAPDASPEEFEKIKQKLIGEKARALVRDGLIPSKAQMDELRKEMNAERREDQKQINAHYARLGHTEERIKRFTERAGDAYRAAIASRHNLDTDAEADYRRRLFEEAAERAGYIQMLAELDPKLQDSVKEIMEILRRTVDSTETLRALELLERHDEAKWKAALARPGKDIKQSCANLIDASRAVIGNTRSKEILDFLGNWVE